MIIWTLKDNEKIWTSCAPGVDEHAHADELLASGAIPPKATYEISEVLPIEEKTKQEKLTKLAQITQDRDAACFADVTVLDHPWQADTRSQQMLASAILLAQAGVYTPTVWRDADNVDVPITNVAQLVAIAGAMAAQTQAAYAQSWARKQALEAATTVEQIEGV